MQSWGVQLDNRVHLVGRVKIHLALVGGQTQLGHFLSVGDHHGDGETSHTVTLLTHHGTVSNLLRSRVSSEQQRKWHTLQKRHHHQQAATIPLTTKNKNLFNPN